MISHDPLRSAQEIRESLASEKRRLTFFLGAGTSMAVGFPGIDSLTQKF
jgi:NAD-dependent SIR2 family protein deacetylase